MHRPAMHRPPRRAWTPPVLPILALVLLVLAPGSASALEHTYPGNMCVPVTGEHPNSSDRVITDAHGQIFNGSPSQTLYVVCPIVGPWNDLSEGTAEVFAHDRNRSEDICCQARLNNAGAIRVGTTDCTEDTDTRAQVLQMEPPVFNFTFTARYFYCRIPPSDRGEQSGIRLYRH